MTSPETCTSTCHSSAVANHIAIQEALDGKVVEWMGLVSDEQYLAGSPNGGDREM